MAHDTTGPARRRKPDRAKISIKGAWTAIPNKLLLDTRLSRDARLLGCLIFLHAANSGTAFPSQEKMAEELGCTRRSVQRWLEELEETGWVIWKQTLRNNKYTLKDPDEPIDDEADSSLNDALTGATLVSHGATQGSHGDATQGSHRVTPVSHSETTAGSSPAISVSHPEATPGSPNATPMSYSEATAVSPTTIPVSHPETTAGSPTTTAVSHPTIQEDSINLESSTHDSSSSESVVDDDVQTPTELFLAEENLGVANELRLMPLEMAQAYVAQAKHRGASLAAIAKGLRAAWKRAQARQREQAAQLDPPGWIAPDAWLTLTPDLRLALDGSTVDDEGYLVYFERHEPVIAAHAETVQVLLRHARTAQAVGDPALGS